MKELPIDWVSEICSENKNAKRQAAAGMDDKKKCL